MYQVSFPGTARRYYLNKDEQAIKFALLVTLEKSCVLAVLMGYTRYLEGRVSFTKVWTIFSNCSVD